jgi:hypothetical protein
MKKISVTILCGAALMLWLGCGGSKSTPQVAQPATSISYVNPTSAAGDWAFVEDATSTAKHLVLDLVGPSDGTKYRGIGFTLQFDPTMIKPTRFLDATGKPTLYYNDGGIFQDRNSFGTEDVPVVLQVGGVSNNNLMVGIYQKFDDSLYGAVGSTSKDCSAVVLQVGFDLDPTLKAMPGPSALTVLKAKLVGDTVNTNATRVMINVPIKVGSITLK